MEERIPKDHPIRTIKIIADEALERLSPEFDQMYSQVGRASVPPERLLKDLQPHPEVPDIRLDRDVAEQRGRYVHVNLEILVKEVVLPPHAAPWFVQAVKSVMHGSPIRPRVTRSAIESPPHESNRQDTG